MNLARECLDKLRQKMLRHAPTLELSWADGPCIVTDTVQVTGICTLILVPVPEWTGFGPGSYALYLE